MRVVVDLDSGQVCPATDYIPGLNRRDFVGLRVSLGDPPLTVQLMRSGVLAALSPVPASLKFVANAYNADGSINFEGPNIVIGQKDLPDEPGNNPAQYPLLQCGEDWAAAALVALFTSPNLVSVDLRGQFLWRVNTDPAGKWQRSNDVNIAVRNTLSATDLIPGALVLGNMYYLSYISRLTGGVAATDLDAIDISVLPDLSVLRVIIPGRGESAWQRQLDATTPVTDTESPLGRIVPINYDPALRPYVLIRESGF